MKYLTYDEYDFFECTVNHKELKNKVNEINSLLREYAKEVNVSFDFESSFWIKEKQEFLFFIEKAETLNQSHLQKYTMNEIIEQLRSIQNKYKVFSDIFIEEMDGSLWFCSFNLENEDYFLKRMQILLKIDELKQMSYELFIKKQNNAKKMNILKKQNEYSYFLKLKEKYEPKN